MANTYTSLHVHLVFSTKNREPWIEHEIENRIWSYTAGIAQQNQIKPIQIGGMPDHLHLLLGLPANLGISKAAQLLKGGSSLWIKSTFENKKSLPGKTATPLSLSAAPTSTTSSNTFATNTNTTATKPSRKSTSHSSNATKSNTTPNTSGAKFPPPSRSDI